MFIVIALAVIAAITAIFLAGYALGVRETEKFNLATVEFEETPVYNKLATTFPDIVASLSTPIE